MSVKSEALKQELDRLTNEELQQVADFIAFLKFRHKRCHPILNCEELAALAIDFAEEDRALAEAGIGDCLFFSRLLVST
jgi:hypothetical protein